MANEFRHGTVGTELSQAEYESITGHSFESQATGDILYASSTTQLSRLAIGAANTILQVNSGIPAWSSTLAGDLTFNDNVKVTLGTGGDADLYYDGTDVILNVAVVGTGDFYVSGGRIEVDDNEGVAFGTGKDATVSYDGTDLVISPAAVGTGDVVISGGRLEVDDDEGLALGTGNDALINYDGTDLIISPAVVGTGDVVISGGRLEVDDSEGVVFGTGKDAKISYDGTDLIITPADVGTGDLVISGASVELDDSESLTLGTGKDATLLYDGTNLVVNPQAVGSGLIDVTAGGLEMNDHIKWDTGVAVTAGNYSVGRNADGTNQLHLNVPTGAGFEFSVNDSAVLTLDANALVVASGVDFALNTAFMQLEEISDPGAPSTNRGVLYVKDNGSGKTQLAIRFATGAVQVIATEP